MRDIDGMTREERHAMGERLTQEVKQALANRKQRERMYTFTMYRRDVPATHNEKQANPAHMPQFEGVVFSDGTVAIRWLTAERSTAVWSSMSSMLAIHGHPEYGSELVWHDGAP